VSLFSPERYRLALTESGLVLDGYKKRSSNASNWQRVAQRNGLDAPGKNSLAKALTEVLQLLPRGVRCTVLMEDTLARLFVLSAPLQVNGPRELQRVASLRSALLFGDTPEDWICLGDWHARGPFLVCALPKALLHGLQIAAKQQRVRLDCIQPQFVHDWNASASLMREPGAWFARIGPQHTALGATDRGRLVAISQSRSTAPTSLDALRTFLLRASLQWGLPLPPVLYVGGELTAGWHGWNVDACRIRHLQLSSAPADATAVQGGRAAPERPPEEVQA